MNNEYIQNFQKFYPYMKANKSGPNKVWTAENINLYLTRIDKILPNRDTINEHQENVLKDMIETLKGFKKLLMPFEDHGIDYELTIGGGAIRDLVLNKCETIGDFDIVLHFPDNIVKSIKNMETLGKLHNLIVTKSEMDENDKIKIVIDEQQVAKLLVKIIDQSNMNYEKFMDKNTIDKVYLTNYINAIIKLPVCSIFKKPVDLILSHRPGHIYVENFDFEICKAFIQYKNETHIYKKENIYQLEGKDKITIQYQNIDLNNDQSHLTLLDHLIVKQSFIRDIEEKTLSLNLAKFEPEHIQYFMNNHYLKLQERYPEYKCNFFIDDITHEKMSKEKLEVKIKNLDLVKFHYYLDDIIPNKPEKIKTMKI